MAAAIMFARPVRSLARRWIAVAGAAVLALVLAAGSGTLVDSSHQALRAVPGEALAPGAVAAVLSDASCAGHRTSSGLAARQGTAAADPAVLPVGSVIQVEAGGPPFDGIYSVMHESPERDGRLLSLYVRSCEDAARFGRRDVVVRVMRTGWHPRQSAPAGPP